MAHLKQTLFSIFTMAMIAAGIGLMSTPAEAGFQFSPAPKAGAASALPDSGPMMPSVSAGKVDADTLTQMPVPPLPAAPSDPMAAGEFTAPVKASAPMAPVPAARSASSLPDAVGFGSDLPLALGMRQIVPAQYAYAFDSGVNQGAKISWNGGKPWDIALNDALKPLGYNATVDGNTVHVSSGAAAPAAMAVPVLPPALSLRASGDLPHPPLSPVAAAPVAPTPAITTAASTSKPVREVYIRRNAKGEDVEERAPGKPEELGAKKDAVPAPADTEEKSAFWTDANPMNWSNHSDAPTVQTVNNNTDSLSLNKNDVPPPPTADVGPVARMSDNDARLAAANGSSAAASDGPVPSGPNDVADAPPPAANAPVMLTHSAGEVSTPAAPPAPIIREAVAPAQDVLDNSSVGKWEAKKGDSLKTVLQQWSEKAKVQLYWVPAQDYKLPKPVSLTGNYADAVANALGTYGDNGARPVGRLHPNLPNGPSVLIIEPASS